MPAFAAAPGPGITMPELAVPPPGAAPAASCLSVTTPRPSAPDAFPVLRCRVFRGLPGQGASLVCPARVFLIYLAGRFLCGPLPVHFSAVRPVRCHRDDGGVW